MTWDVLLAEIEAQEAVWRGLWSVWANAAGTNAPLEQDGVDTTIANMTNLQKFLPIATKQAQDAMAATTALTVRAEAFIQDLQAQAWAALERNDDATAADLHTQSVRLVDALKGMNATIDGALEHGHGKLIRTADELEAHAQFLILNADEPGVVDRLLRALEDFVQAAQKFAQNFGQGAGVAVGGIVTLAALAVGGFFAYKLLK